MKAHKINDIEVKKVRGESKKEELFGSDILSNPYGVVALIAKTNSGKTNCLYNILSHTIDPKMKTNVVIFCSTIDLDATYSKIITMLEKKKCTVMTHPHFMSENGENIIDEYLHIIQNPLQEDDEEDYNTISTRMPDGCSYTKKVKKTHKKKIVTPEKLSPKWIFIMDDLGKDTRHNAMNYVMKARHYKVRTFILTQHLSNLSPMVRKQIATCLLFRSFSKDKLQMIYEDLDIEVSFKIFEKLYKFATIDLYNFLTYDVYSQRFRKNFNTEISLNEEE